MVGESINCKTVIDIAKYHRDNIVLTYEKGMVINVNGKRVLENTMVIKDDEVVVNTLNINPKRNLDIEVSEDKLRAYVNIEYIDGYIYKVGEVIEENILSLKYIKERLEPKTYSKEEIILALKVARIKADFIVDSLSQDIERGKVKKILVARGREPIADEDDKIEILFEKEEVLDQNRKIDYREVKKINMIKQGEVLGFIKVGKLGENGTDIFGGMILKKNKKKIPLTIGENCVLDRGNIIATIDGRPEFKRNTFKVIKLLQMDKNINMESGNIDFIGDVHIKGDIETGMTVVSGASIYIEGNIESCTVKAKTRGALKGKVILSNILIGLEDEDSIKYKTSICSIIEDFKNLLMFSKVLLEKNKKLEFGKTLKLIIEKKLNTLNKNIFSILANNNSNPDIREILRKKFIGLGVLTIKDSRELELIIQRVEEEKNRIEKSFAQRGELFLDYTQDSKISCSGDVYFSGKGSYISTITSGGAVEFLEKESVVRGGEIIAFDRIKGKISGSKGGARTVLKVQEDGVIEFETVYRNTLLYFGKLNKLIEEDCTDLKAFVKKGQIEVEKTIL